MRLRSLQRLDCSTESSLWSR